MCQADSATSLRTNALTILARMIAKDILRKSAVGERSENAPQMTGKKAHKNAGDTSNRRRLK